MLSLWDFEVSHFRDLLATSAVYGGNASYLEELDARGDPALARALAQAEALARADGATSGDKAASGDGDLSLRAQRLTDAHRLLGARVSEINPLQYEESPPPELSLSHYGFGPQDEKSAAIVDVAFGDQSRMPLGELLDSMRRTYRGKFVAEFMHVSDSAQREWLRRYVETRCARPDCDAAARRRLLERLSAAEMLEGYLHKKYVGQKAFFARRRRHADSADGLPVARGRGGRRYRDRHRHGAPRAAQYARQCSRQNAGRTFPRIRRRGERGEKRLR